MSRKTIHLLLFMALSLAVGCQDAFFEAEPIDSPEQNFLFLWNTFNERYAPFEQRNINWEELFARYFPIVESMTGLGEAEPATDSLFSVCASMLGELDDAHVTLTVPGREVWNANRIFRQRIDDNKFDLDIVQARIGPTSTSGPITSAVVRDTIGFDVSPSGILPITVDTGYIRVAHFRSSNASTIDVILAKMPEVIGMIIDLRHNGGGDFRNGLSLAARFADKERLAFSTKTKLGPKPPEFSPRIDWYVKPEGPKQFTEPVILLTDRFTVSAAERAVLALRTLPHVQIVGDTTSGAFGDKVAKEMPNGWFFSLSSQIVYGPDNVSYEGSGIPPDHVARNDIFDIHEGRDRVLNEAFSRLVRFSSAKKR